MFCLYTSSNFPAHNLNFGEGDGIKCMLPFKIFSTLSNLTFIIPFFRYQGSYSPVVDTEYDDETDSNYEDYSGKTATTNSGGTRYEAGSYFDQSQSENAGSDYNQNQGSSNGAVRNSGSGKEFCTTF